MAARLSPKPDLPCPEVCIRVLTALGYRVTKPKPRRRFKVVEYFSYYAVRDLWTGQERAMSDGVGALSTPTGKAMSPGSERFRRLWEKSLNENPDETADAYGFPLNRDC